MDSEIHTLNLILTDHRLEDVCLGQAAFTYPLSSPQKVTHLYRLPTSPGVRTKHVIVPCFKVIGAELDGDKLAYAITQIKHFFSYTPNLSSNATRTLHIVLGGEDFNKSQGMPGNVELYKSIVWMVDKIRSSLAYTIDVWWLGFGDPKAFEAPRYADTLTGFWDSQGYISPKIQYEDVHRGMVTTDYWPQSTKFTPDFLMKVVRRIFVHITTYKIPTFEPIINKRVPYPRFLIVKPTELTSKQEMKGSPSGQNTKKIAITSNGAPVLQLQYVTTPNTPEIPVNVLKRTFVMTGLSSGSLPPKLKLKLAAQKANDKAESTTGKGSPELINLEGPEGSPVPEPLPIPDPTPDPGPEPLPEPDPDPLPDLIHSNAGENKGNNDLEPIIDEADFGDVSDELLDQLIRKARDFDYLPELNPLLLNHGNSIDSILGESAYEDISNSSTNETPEPMEKKNSSKEIEKLKAVRFKFSGATRNLR